MKTVFTLLTFFLFSSHIFSQLIGDESLSNISVYNGQFVVNGDKDTYYPVIFRSGNQDRINHLRIYRAFHEAGPNELSPTHKGGLTLEIDVNYGGWGGSSYNWRIMDLRQTYHETFAGATYAMHNMGFVLWLRGGGFVYHYESEYPSNLVVCYVNELIYDYPDPAYPYYDAYAPSPVVSIDWGTISGHMIGNSEFSNVGSDNGITSGYGSKLNFFGASENTDPLYISRYNSSANGSELRVNIGDDLGQASDKFVVGLIHSGDAQWHPLLTVQADKQIIADGKITATEIQVKQNVWADFVFTPTYKLRPLSEVEQFIKINSHLPEIPKAEEVQQNGVNLGEMQLKLLQKVEELTLYSIEQEKANTELKKKLAEQDDKYQKLLQMIEELKNTK